MKQTECEERNAEIERLAFYHIVNMLNTRVAELMEKSDGRFSPKNGTSGYIVVPKNKEYLLEVKNEFGFSIRNYCKGVWPNMPVVPPSEIDLVYENGKWEEKHLADNTWAIIDSEGYGKSNVGEKSFVLFKV